MQFKLTSPFRFWSTFGQVQNPFKNRSYFRPPSQMVFLGVCRSALFFVCPSGCLSQSEADCGLWQVAPSPPLTSFKPSYRLPLPSQQNIPALSTKSCCFFNFFSSNIFRIFMPAQQNILSLSTKSCCFFKYFLFLQRFVYIVVLFLLRLAKVKIDRWPTFREFPDFTAMSTFKNENKFIYTASTLQSKVTVVASLESMYIIWYFLLNFSSRLTGINLTVRFNLDYQQTQY